MTSGDSRAVAGPRTERQPSLLERVAGGDRAAVPRLLDEYGPLVWSIARKLVGTAGAEDVVQEVFIQLWKNAHRFDPERASEATFITTIARRRAIDHQRRVGRRPELEELPDEAPAETDALAAVELIDEARVAAEALAQLKPEQQQVLRLALVEGLTHTQIAVVTKLPLGTVKSHARRGLERVRALLKERRAGGEGGS
jgi:RNA polymerase sigma-70 factor (ECF subfamily)